MRRPLHCSILFGFLGLLLFVGGALPVSGYSLLGYQWPEGTQITMHLQLSRAAVPLQDGSASWNASAADALNIWNQYLDTVKFVADTGSTAWAHNGANDVSFSKTMYGDTWPIGVLAVTLNYSAEGSGVSTEADVIFNDNYKWNSYRGVTQGSGSTATFDLHRVALHEFGHVLGLDHPDQAGQSVGAMMNSIIGNLDQLAADDISGAQVLYGTRITSPLGFQTIFAGDAFSYQITANNHPTSFSASGLPAGLQIDEATGIISGTPTSLGTFQVTLVAHGAPRDATGTLTLFVSDGAHFTNPLNISGNVGDPIDLPLTTSASVPYINIETSLPRGLSYDSMNRRIYGAPITAGTTDLKISASTGSGTFKATLHFDIGPRTHDFPTFLDLTSGSDYYHSSTESFYTPSHKLSVVTDEFNRVIVGSLLGQVTIYFQGGGFERLHPGVYDGANSSGSPTDKSALNIQDGNQCDQGAGTFTIKEITYGAQETILSFWATFEQHCSGGLKTQHTGEIRYHVDANDPLVVPVISAPATLEVNQGESISIQPTATNGATRYSAAGLPYGMGLFPDTGKITGTPTVAGTFVVRVFATNSLGTGETDITITVHPGPSRPHSLLNISTRGHVGTGDNIMIGGFIIRGSERKTVVVRGIGPSLPVGGALADPAMRLTFPNGNAFYTDNWIEVPNPLYGGGWQIVAGTGLGPSSRFEPAVLFALDPGAYTVGLSGVNNTTGVALAEAYDITPFASSLANISTRARVGEGDEVLIGGFIIGGDQPTNVVVRAIGPSLTQSGVPEPLLDPMLQLFDGNGALLADDDDWRTYQDQLVQTGLAPTDDRESAMLLTLQPGAYTAIVRGKNNGTGVGLVEVYNLDAN